MSDIKPEDVWQVLGSILDPEFNISIVDLGLIYSVESSEGNVHVVMTLTTPTCPSGSWMHEGVQTALRNMPGVASATVDLVFDPQWHPGMLSASARKQLGWEAAG